MWYKLPHQSLDEKKQVQADADYEILEMCSLASTGGEVDIYFDHESEPTSVEKEKPRNYDGNEGIGIRSLRFSDIAEHLNVEEEIENEDEDVRVRVEDSNVVSVEDANIIDDETIAELFREVEMNEYRRANEEYISDDEFVDDDNVCPGTPQHTDKEWEAFDRPRKKVHTSRVIPKGDELLLLGTTFTSAEDFKDALFQYVLDTTYDVKLSRWEHDKLAAVCSHKGCGWRVYCSIEKSQNKWMIKVFNPDHPHQPTGTASMLSKSHIAKLFSDILRRKPSFSAADMQYVIKRKWGLTVNISKCFKARREALGMVMEDQKTQFAKLWDYEAELRRSNPNTSTEIQTKLGENGEELFDCFYVCFEMLRESWKHNCRPVIGLDGCFLKWELKGELLAAVGRDADNRIYPIAWAVVRIEDSDTWGWFLRKLKVDLCLGDGQHITILSDKQKGLINAVEHKLPLADHRMCARHIYANWKKVYKELDMKLLFWKATCSFHLGEFTAAMDELKSKNPAAYEALIRKKPEQWARAFFKEESRCSDVHNNLSESFNRTIRDARRRPMIDMLEDIRRQTMQRIAKRSVESTKWVKEFSPKAVTELEKAREKTKYCIVFPSGRGLFEVMEFGVSYSVDLSGKRCACRRWDLTGLPCQHALAVINERQLNISRYVSEFYSKIKLEATYQENLMPVNGEPMWQKLHKPPIGVPLEKRMPGRPSKYHR
ncbi:PREDICTED: uncharacterized protein LOC104815131 [Tarenaya hassleriana]|uniref:uncharacterized protein LOC104815131 n=1 Tax=Tarenaya hassleriana TaxID=28532 RepID=UPI00053C5895|nr:PREDICTED: uncharacterized protein LOC104815131 [Tarenaya hassleriana]